MVAGAGHFRLDHVDYACDIRYYNETLDLGVEVQVTQHVGSDSDKWLLHEVESSFRGRTKEGWLGQSLYESASIREIDGNKIFDYGYVDYRWISNYIVVYIHYTDLSGNKAEPLEVVRAYLQKFPSSITLTDNEAKIRVHNEIWIKDEMERRLWLCDKWFLQLQIGKVELDSTLREVVDHLVVFLDYRGKYYGINPTDEKTKLQNYLISNDGTLIKNKLTEYKTWWIANKTKSINLP